MKKNLFLISLLIITNVGVLLSQNFESFNITFDGLEREYTIYVPSSYDGLTPVPLIFSFHGGGGTASGHIAINNFSELAESENFIAVYPQAAIDPQDGSNAWIHKAPTSHDDIFFVEASINLRNCLDFSSDGCMQYLSMAIRATPAALSFSGSSDEPMRLGIPNPSSLK